MNQENKQRNVTFAVTASDTLAIDTIAGRMPLATTHLIVRTAARLGLGLMAQDEKLAKAQLLAQRNARNGGVRVG